MKTYYALEATLCGGRLLYIHSGEPDVEAVARSLRSVFYNADKVVGGTVKADSELEAVSKINQGDWVSKEIHGRPTFEFEEDASA